MSKLQAVDAQSAQKILITRNRDGISEETTDWLAVEEPLEISLVQAPNPPTKVSITMRTPGNDQELAAGFLFTEGIVQKSSDIAKIAHTQTLPGVESNTILVELAADCKYDAGSLNRNFYTTSSCGVCGKASIDAIQTVRNISVDSQPFAINSNVMGQLPELLRLEQETFEKTGGLHACALFTIDGKMVALREDVGRHNALDKLIGHFLLKDEMPLDKHILLLSGRASFELVQKAAMAGIRVVLAVGAPSSLAVETAGNFGICLIGFVRNNSFNIYSCPEDITINP